MPSFKIWMSTQPKVMCMQNYLLLISFQLNLINAIFCIYQFQEASFRVAAGSYIKKDGRCHFKKPNGKVRLGNSGLYFYRNAAYSLSSCCHIRWKLAATTPACLAAVLLHALPAWLIFFILTTRTFELVEFVNVVTHIPFFVFSEFVFVQYIRFEKKCLSF